MINPLNSGSIYIEEDGSLIVILEAILAMTVKPSKQKSVKKVQKTDEPMVDDNVASVCLWELLYSIHDNCSMSDGSEMY